MMEWSAGPVYMASTTTHLLQSSTSTTHVTSDSVFTAMSITMLTIAATCFCFIILIMALSIRKMCFKRNVKNGCNDTPSKITGKLENTKNAPFTISPTTDISLVEHHDMIPRQCSGINHPESETLLVKDLMESTEVKLKSALEIVIEETEENGNISEAASLEDCITIDIDNENISDTELTLNTPTFLTKKDNVFERELRQHLPSLPGNSDMLTYIICKLMTNRY